MTTISAAPALGADAAARRAGLERGGSILRAAIASEWIKLRSVRSTVWSLLVTMLLTVGFGALFSAAFAARHDQLSVREQFGVDPTAVSLRGMFLAQLAIGVLGVLVISGEYATGTIRATFAATPQRRTVLAAKAIVFGAVALSVALISVFMAFLVGQSILAGKGLGVSIADPGVLRAVIGAGAYLTVVGLLGFAFGAILRRTSGAISAIAGLVFVLPLLAQALPSPWNDDVSKYLPSGAGAALFSVQSVAGRLTPGAGSAVLLAWLVATIGVAVLLVTRRDA